MLRIADAGIEIHGDDGYVWKDRCSAVFWLPSEYEQSAEFFPFPDHDHPDPDFDPRGGAIHTWDWMGALGPRLLREADGNQPPVEFSGTLFVDEVPFGLIYLTRSVRGLSDHDYVLFEGTGPPPDDLIASRRERYSSQEAARLLDAIDEVRQFAHEVEDSAKTEAERACARSVRNGLQVLEEFALGRSDVSLARAAINSLKSWAGYLRNLAGYAKLVELGVRLATFLQQPGLDF